MHFDYKFPTKVTYILSIYLVFIVKNDNFVSNNNNQQTRSVKFNKYQNDKWSSVITERTTLSSCQRQRLFVAFKKRLNRQYIIFIKTSGDQHPR